jgi:glutathione synthase/RimK-type ligase-like ATP-grasp enzyme
LLEHLPCPVVNRLDGSMSNHSKPYQALLIRRCGLRTPPTLVTDDPGAARRFIGEHREVIYKSVSGLRSIVRRVGAEQMRRLPLLRHGPTQFQRFIPGENIRVHAVANRLFATRIASDQVDYRYVPDGVRPPEMAPIELPPAIATACLKLMRHLDLLFAGIDLKRTPDGDYYCFEVNPSPAFLFYERGAGQPISAALADLLRGGPSRRGP